jgi:hypothetical protein
MSSTGDLLDTVRARAVLDRFRVARYGRRS